MSSRARCRRLALAAVLACLGLRRPAGAAVAAVAPGALPPGAPTTVPVAPALPRVPPPPDLPRDRPLRAGFVLEDGVSGTELIAAFDVLQHTVLHTRPGVDVLTLSAEGTPVTTSSGMQIAARYGLANAPPLDLLVVPGGAHNMDADLGNDVLVGWLAKAGKQARLVVGLGDGAFLLAKAGLLPMRIATTSAADQDRFAQMFPKQQLRRGVSFVHDGSVLTSVGGARASDAALYLVDHLFGEQVARAVAKDLALPWPPGEEEAPLPALVVRYNKPR